MEKLERVKGLKKIKEKQWLKEESETVFEEDEKREMSVSVVWCLMN